MAVADAAEYEKNVMNLGIAVPPVDDLLARRGLSGRYGCRVSTPLVACAGMDFGRLSVKAVIHTM
jgi:hypothetical protein